MPFTPAPVPDVCVVDTTATDERRRDARNVVFLLLLPLCVLPTWIEPALRRRFAAFTVNFF